MPTPIWVDGFEHQTLSVNSFGAASTGIWDLITALGPASINTTNQRTGAACLQMSPTATIDRCYRLPTGADPTIMVVSFYIRFTTLPTVGRNVFRIGCAVGGQGDLHYNSGTGKLHIAWANTLTGSDVGPVLATGIWYLVDLRANVSVDPRLLDCRIDGGTNVQVSLAGTASACDGWVLGADSVAATYTAQYDDLVVSATSADYPIGPHKVLSLVPTGDGTHNAGTVVETQAGVDLTAGAGFGLVDEWPANTSDYIQQSAVGAGNYGELTFPDTTETIVWGAVGYSALFSQGTTANAAITRIVNAADATLVDLYSGDMSETTLHYKAALIPGVNTPTILNGLKARVGFGSTVPAANLPRWSALMVQYAVPDAFRSKPLVASTAVNRASRY